MIGRMRRLVSAERVGDFENWQTDRRGLRDKSSQNSYCLVLPIDESSLEGHVDFEDYETLQTFTIQRCPDWSSH